MKVYPNHFNLRSTQVYFYSTFYNLHCFKVAVQKTQQAHNKYWYSINNEYKNSIYILNQCDNIALQNILFEMYSVPCELYTLKWACVKDSSMTLEFWVWESTQDHNASVCPIKPLIIGTVCCQLWFHLTAAGAGRPDGVEATLLVWGRLLPGFPTLVCQAPVSDQTLRKCAVLNHPLGMVVWTLTPPFDCP